MPNLTYENQGINTYLVYQIGEADELDTMSLGMLTNNAIPGFAAVSFTQMDTAKYIKYNVSAKVSVAQLFAGAVNKKRLIGVFMGVVDAMLSAEDYMLDTNSLLLDLDYIFADVSTCETVVICLPIMNAGRMNPDISVFFKNIIFNTQFDQTENCDHVAQILNYLNSNPVFSLSDFKQLLEKLAKGGQNSNGANPQKPITTEPQKTSPFAAHKNADASNTSVQFAQPAKAGTVPKREEPQLWQNNSCSAQPTVPANQQQVISEPVQEQDTGAKPMSMFYLLQHYSKKNAAIYKAQKEAKKANKEKSPSPVPSSQPAAPKPTPKQPKAGFAIPGRQEPAAPSFAVPSQQSASAQQPVQPVIKAAPQQTVPTEEAAPIYQQLVQSGRPINFGETTFLGGAIGETTALEAAVSPVKAAPHLIRIKNNEKIPLNKPVFRIGKERSYVDYFISDNTAISRSHANIINHNGDFVIVDTNSTNHTYVNGAMIHSNEEIKLTHGAKIRLANEDFEFRLY